MIYVDNVIPPSVVDLCLLLMGLCCIGIMVYGIIFKIKQETK